MTNREDEELERNGRPQYMRVAIKRLEATCARCFSRDEAI